MAESKPALEDVLARSGEVIEPLNIFFASTHGSLTLELAMLCRETGNRMFLLASGCSLAHEAGWGHPEHEFPFFARLGVETIASNEELLDRTAEADLFVVVSPLQVDLARRLVKCPVAVIAGLCIEKSVKGLNELGVNNHLSPSARHLTLLTGRNKLVYPKLIWKETLAKPAPPEERLGFYSYIHWLDRNWPIGATKLRKLNSISKIPIKNFGFQSEHGVVDDLVYMAKAKATVHLKDAGVTCNAPIRSLVSGTPVLMDRESYDNCFFDCIGGLTVVATVDDLIEEINRLDSDTDYLREKSFQAKRASDQFAYRQEHGNAFTAFLEKVS